MGKAPLSREAAVGCDPTSSSCAGQGQTRAGLSHSLVAANLCKPLSHSLSQFTRVLEAQRASAGFAASVEVSEPHSLCADTATPGIFWYTQPQTQHNVHQHVCSRGPAPTKVKGQGPEPTPQSLPGLERPEARFLLRPGGGCLSHEGDQGNHLATVHFPFSLIQLTWLNLFMLKGTF